MLRLNNQIQNVRKNQTKKSKTKHKKKSLTRYHVFSTIHSSPSNHQLLLNEKRGHM